MSFERKITAAQPAELNGYTPEPGDQSQARTVEIQGGARSLRDRGHKDHGHVIGHNFELRSILSTTKYRGSVSGAFSLDPGEFAYNIIRATGPLTINLEKPSAVPDDQLTPLGRRRYRQRVSFLEIYYATSTTVSFGPGFIFGRSGYNLEKSEPDVDGLVDVSLESMQLDAELAGLPKEGVIHVPRAFGTMDLLMVSYNERTGQATVAPLALGVVGAADPAVPVDDGTGEETPEPETPDDGTGGYTDPDTGELLPVVKPEPGNGLLYALHPLSISRSRDCGATWEHFPVSVPLGGNLVDIAANRSAVFLLTSQGQVLYATSLGTGFKEIPLDGEKGKVEILLQNGDFEAGSITKWTAETPTHPVVLATVHPDQRPGSTYYLSRDWSLASAPSFLISQAVEIPPHAMEKQQLNLEFDALTTGGETARVEVYELLGEEGEAVVRQNFTVRVHNSGYTVDSFATDENGDELKLEMIKKNGLWEASLLYEGIQLGSGAYPRDYVGELTLRVMKSDGTPYGGQATIEFFDLDSPNEKREYAEFTGDLSYEILEDTVTAENISGGVRFSGWGGPLTDNNEVPSQFRVTFRGDCNLKFTGFTKAGLGMRSGSAGPGGASKRLLISATGTGSRWEEVRGQYYGKIPARVSVEVSNAGGSGGVWIDNIRLTASDASTEDGVTAISATRDGADLYFAENALVSYVPGDSVLDPEATPFSSAFTAALGPRGRIAADSSGVQVKAAGTDWQPFVQGGVPALIGMPDIAILGANGAVFGPQGGMGTASAQGKLAGDNKRLLAVSTSPIGEMKLHSWSGLESPMARQPVKASAVGRGTCPTDSGRYIGWSTGNPDIFWTDGITEKWRYGGGIGHAIRKIVEAR